MRVYLISYDLIHPDSIKSELSIIEAIKNFTGFWWHYCGIWLVAGESITAQELNGKMKAMLKVEGKDTDDSLFIARISANDTQGWLPESAWNWLKKQAQKDAS